MASVRTRNWVRVVGMGLGLGALAACGGGSSGGGGPVDLGTPTHTAAGILDIGGSGTDYAEVVATFADASFVVAGSHDAEVVVGAGDPNETTFATPGIYVARFAADRTLVWARNVLAPPGSWLASACALADGRAVVAGQFGGTVTFAPGELGEVTLTSPPNGAVFVAAYEADGDLSFAHQITATVGVFSAALGARALGGYFLAGGFEGTVTFPDASSATAGTLASAGTFDDVYLAAYDASDTWLGARQLSGPGDSYVSAVASTSDGGVFVAGSFGGSLLLGAGEPNQTTLTSAGGFDVAVARFNPTLDLLWARRAGGPGDDASDAGAGLPGDGFAIAGSFGAGMTFDGAVPDAASLPRRGRRRCTSRATRCRATSRGRAPPRAPRNCATPASARCRTAASALRRRCSARPSSTRRASPRPSSPRTGPRASSCSGRPTARLRGDAP